MQKYLGVKLIEATQMIYGKHISEELGGNAEAMMTKEEFNKEGYRVKYSDNYISWSPKEVFEKAYFEIGDNKINNETFNNFIAEEVVKTEEVFGKPTTVMHVRLVNGMVISDSTTCVDPKNYSEEIGAEILRKRIADKIWFGLGFALQCGLRGVK